MNTETPTADVVKPEPETAIENVDGEKVEVESAELETETKDQQAEDRTEADNKEKVEEAAKEEPAEKPKKNRGSERIRKLNETTKQAVAEKKAAERALARAKKRLARYEMKEPTPDDYDGGEFDAKYAADLAVYQSAKGNKEDVQDDINDAKTVIDESEHKALQARIDAHNVRVEGFKAVATDFDEVVNNPSLQVSKTMADLLLDSENSAQIAYYLGKNPSLSAKISTLTTEREVARELGRIEGQLKAPKPRKISQAPKPIKAVATGSGGTTVDLSKLSYDDYRKARGY